MTSFVNFVLRTFIRLFARGSRAIAARMIRYVHVSGLVRVRVQQHCIKLYAAADDALTSKLYYDDWEKDVTFWFCEFSKKYFSFFDVGANIGIYSLLAGKSNSSAVIHAFEPNPYNFARLEKNVFLNGLDGRVSTHRFALGNTTGHISFYVPADNRISDMSSAYRAHAVFSKDFEHRRINVPSVTLDAFCQKQGLMPQIIKIDVELYELQVLLGMQSVLKTIRPIVFCEIFNDEVRRRINRPLDSEMQHGYTLELERYLNTVGYSIYAIVSKGILYVDSLRSSHDSTMYLLLPIRLKEPFYLTTDLRNVLDELSCG